MGISATRPIGEGSSLLINFSHTTSDQYQEKDDDSQSYGLTFGLDTSLGNQNLSPYIIMSKTDNMTDADAFSFMYGMEILKNDGAVINVIRAGNDNLFRSKIFANTVATLIGHEIEIYNTTGAFGAARASGVMNDNLDSFRKKITKISGKEILFGATAAGILSKGLADQLVSFCFFLVCR